MNYYDAARIRKKGFANLMTDKLTSGQGVVSSFRGALSDRSKAKSMAMKEKFDPLNIAKFLTGGSKLAPAILGRLTGRSKEDIGYFTGKKQYQPYRKSSSSTSYWDRFNNPSMGGSGKATEVLEKIVSFMEKSKEDETKEQDILDSQSEMNELVKTHYHKEVMSVFNEAIKKKRKAMKEMAKETKKREDEEKAKEKTDKVEQKKEETKPAVEATKPVTKETKPAAETTKPVTKETKPAPEAGKTTTKQIETAPAAPPTVTPAPPATVPQAPIVKPAITEAAKTAVKVAVGAGAAMGAVDVIARIKTKEGFQGKAYHDPKKDKNGKIVEDRYSVGYGHQITPQEVKQGYIKLGETTVPVSGSLGKETVITEPQASLLITQDYEKYDRAVKKITNFDKLSPEAQLALRDMTYNMGEGWFSPEKWPKLHQALTNLDMNGVADSISNSLYYQQTGKRAKENVELIRNSSVKLEPEKIPMEKSPGDVIEKMSKETADMKKEVSQSGGIVAPTIIQNNTTNKQRNITVPSAPIEELNPRMRR